MEGDMMRVMKHSMLLIAVLMILTAGAQALTYLPNSSHYSGTNDFVSYSGINSGVAGRIEFAVYDTVANPNQFVGTDGFADSLPNWSSPDDGQFIYAYQIFVDSSSTDPFEYFAILGIGAGALTSESQMGSTDDFGTGQGIDTDSADLENDNSKAIWTFSQELLVKNERSYVLYLVSDHDYKSGSFAVKRPSDELAVPNPEPGTLALLGVGGLLAYRRKHSV